MTLDASLFRVFLSEILLFLRIKSYTSRKTAQKMPVFEYFRQKIALKVPYWCRRSASMPEKQMVSMVLGQDRLFSRDCGTNKPGAGLFEIAS